MADAAADSNSISNQVSGLSIAHASDDTAESAAMSKNASKKKLKMKHKEEERQKKEAENQKKKAEMIASAQAQTKTQAVADDEDMDPTQYFENRLRTLAATKMTGANPYPHAFPATISMGDYLKKYAYLTDGEHLKDVKESIAGRIMSIRTSSSKLVFYDLHGGGVKVQVMADLRDSNMDEADFSRLHSGVKRGDIVGIHGYPGKSKRGELSIFPKEFIVLSLCLHMMPKQQKVQPGSEKTLAKKQDLQLNREWAPGMTRHPDNYI